MALKDRIDVQFHKAFLSVYIGGRPMDALSAIIEHGYDTVSAAARLMLPEVPAHVRIGQKVEVRAGWDGFVIPIFNGWLEDDGRGYFPFDGEMRAAGHMKRTQYQYPNELTYSSQTDATIVIDLLDKAGASRQAGIDGSGTTLGTVKAVKLEAGTPTFELINRIDQVFGYKTFDTPGGIVRKKVSGIPAANVVWSYAEGDNILRVYRNRTLRGIHNRVVVTGLPQDSGTPSSTWEADNPLVPDPPGHISFDFRSDLIESDSVASDVAERLLGEKNRVLEDVVIEVAGNPYLAPGMTVGVTSGRLGLDSETPYRIAHVSHLLDPSGFITRLTVEGGAGQAGYEVPGDGTSGVNPQAVIDYRVDYETFDDGGGSANYYTVDASGAGSVDNDGAPGTLSYSWSNDTNADTSSAETYATAFTSAELAGGPVISLEVTDADGNTDTATVTIADDGSTPILQREIFAAADGQAEATSDGGANWQTWTPSAGTVVSTPEIAPEGIGWYGLSNGKLHKTDDYLATAPSEVHDFGSQVNAIWVNEVDGERVTVGLADGTVHRSVDGGSNWTELTDYANAVLWVIESAFNPGEYRVATGDSIRITFDDFANDSALITWSGGTARWGALSPFSNYGCATHADEVKREDGTVITGLSSSDVRAITHHIRDDILYAAELDGSDADTYAKAAGATAFTAAGVITGAGQPNHMIRDGDSPQVIYLAAANGLYKTYDGADSWVTLRDYSGAGLAGNQVGYGSAPWQAVTAVTEVSDTTANDADIAVLSLWNGSSNDDPPDGWRDVGFDDSGWSAAVEVSGSGSVPTGAKRIWDSDSTASGEEGLIRHTFTLSAGIVSSATLEFSNDDLMVGIWINGISVYVEEPAVAGSPVITVTIDPNILISDGDNVLAFHNRDTGGSDVFIAYRLEIS